MIVQKQIRVLQVFGALDCGGAETMIMNIYRKINRNEIQFDFIKHTSKECVYDEEIKKLGGNIYVIPRYKVVNHFSYIKAWKKFYKEHQEYKIIHCHIRSVASLVLKVSKMFGLKTICHSHSTSNGKGFKSFVKQILQRKIPKYTDCFMACSKESARWLYGEKIFESKKCLIINNAIDLDKYLFNNNVRQNMRKKLKIDNETILIGQIGRIEQVKNHPFTIDIFKELLKQNDRKYKLIIIGDGFLKNKIYKMCDDYGILNNVIFTGIVDNVNEYLQAIDLFLMPSFYEGLPLCLVEAQAASLKCIISDNINDGIIIKSLVKQISIHDIDSWIESITNLKNINKRINHYKEIKENGFDINDNVEKLTSIYLTLLK